MGTQNLSDSLMIYCLACRLPTHIVLIDDQDEVCWEAPLDEETI